MAIDFTDPNQVQTFRQNAISKGYKEADIERYVKKRVVQQTPFTYDVAGKPKIDESTTDLGSVAEAVKTGTIKLTDIPVEERMKVGVELSKSGFKPSSAPKALSDLTEFEKKVVNARLAGQKALDILNEGGELAGPLTTRAGQLGEFFGMPGKGTDYRSAINLASGQLFNALAGTTQSPAELKRLEKIMPKDTDQEATAKAKLESLLGMLDDQAQAYGITIPGLPSDPSAAMSQDEDKLPTIEETAKDNPVYNSSGDLASPGDLVRDDTGKLSLFGQADETIRVKRSDDGAEIDSNLIDFLAKSELLPIVGSIAGGMAGAGVGSLATGAAGAMVGKSIQMYLREITDPDNNNLSSAGKAIIVEGTIDAVLGGLTLGVLKVAGKGVALVLKQPGKELAEEGGESWLKGTARNMAEKYTRKGSKITPTKAQKFLNQTGKRFEQKAVEEGMVTADELAEGGLKILKTNKAKLTKLLEGKTANTSEIVDILEKAKEPYLRKLVTTEQTPTIFDEAGKALTWDTTEKVKTIVKPDARAGVATLNKYIEWVKSYGDTIDAQNLNEVKAGLQEVFGKGLDVAGTSKELVAGTSSKIKAFIEKFHPEIKGTNQEIIFGHLANEMGEKSLTYQNGKALLSLTDLIMGAANLPIAVVRKSLDLLVDSPEAKAQFLVKLFSLAKEKGNKKAMRTILMAGWTDKLLLKVDQGIYKTALNAAKQTAEAGVANMVSDTESLPATPPELGSNPGIDLGAFSPEGAPLYR